MDKHIAVALHSSSNPKFMDLCTDVHLHVYRVSLAPSKSEVGVGRWPVQDLMHVDDYRHFRPASKYYKGVVNQLHDELPGTVQRLSRNHGLS